MTIRKRQIATLILAVWLFLVISGMILTGAPNLEIFFILWVIGLIVIVELIEPPYLQPRYIRYLRYVVAGGVVVSGVIVVQKVLEIVQI